METNNSDKNQKKINNAISEKDHYKQVLKEIKIIGRRSDLLRFHRDTDNLDFDGR